VCRRWVVVVVIVVVQEEGEGMVRSRRGLLVPFRLAWVSSGADSSWARL
jgi:hypothetical protein